MANDKRRLNITDDPDLDSFVLIPYLASVEYSERVDVFGFLNGEGRPVVSVDRVALSRFEMASSNLRWGSFSVLLQHLSGIYAPWWLE